MAPNNVNSSLVVPSQPSSGTAISAGPKTFLGPNFTISNDTTGVTSKLAFSTDSVITANSGFNIRNMNDGTAKLTINSSGDVNTLGYLVSQGSIDSKSNISASGSLNSSSLNVIKNGVNVTTISDGGDVTTNGYINALGNLSVGSKFSVASSSGSLTLGGTITSAGSVFVGGTSATPNLTLGNDGTIVSTGDLNAGQHFRVTASTGKLVMGGDLNIGQSVTVNSTTGELKTIGDIRIDNNGANKFIVLSNSGTIQSQGNLNLVGTAYISGGIETYGKLSSLGNLTVNLNKFTVDSTNGNTVALGTLSVANSNFMVTDNGSIIMNGDINLNSGKFVVNHGDGSAKSSIAYGSYTPNSSASNTTTTAASGVEPTFDSVSNKFLTTQEYVDKQIWNQTKRINTILGTDSTVVDNFNNVYKLVDALAGHSDTVTYLQDTNEKYGTLVNRSNDLVSSVSDVSAKSFNTVLMNPKYSVWADACPPMPIPPSVTTYLFDGWFFQNLSAGNKINWYLPTNSCKSDDLSEITIRDVQNMFLNIFAASNVSLPFISIYTQPKGNNTDLYPGFANACVNYYFSDVNTSSIANKTYSLYTGDKVPVNTYNVTPLKYSSTSTRNKLNDTENNGVGNIIQNTSGNSGFDTSKVSLDDKISCFAIQTASTAAVDSVSMVVSSLNVQLNTGTTQFTFSNAGVVMNYLFYFLFKKNSDMSPVIDGSLPATLFNTYNAKFNSA